jgi:hypothetical protein
MIMVRDGKAVEPTSVQICVAYDATHGNIVHAHSIVLYPGGRIPKEMYIEKATLELAARQGHDGKALKTIIIDPKQYDGKKAYKVDVKSTRLIEIQLTRRK